MRIPRQSLRYSENSGCWDNSQKAHKKSLRGNKGISITSVRAFCSRRHAKNVKHQASKTHVFLCHRCDTNLHPHVFELLPDPEFLQPLGLSRRRSLLRLASPLLFSLPATQEERAGTKSDSGDG